MKREPIHPILVVVLAGALVFMTFLWFAASMEEHQQGSAITVENFRLTINSDTVEIELTFDTIRLENLGNILEQLPIEQVKNIGEVS